MWIPDEKSRENTKGLMNTAIADIVFIDGVNSLNGL